MGFLKKFRWNILVNLVGSSKIIPHNIRYIIYRAAGMKIYTNDIRSGLIFRGSNVTIEKGVLINHNTFIDCHEKVHIKKMLQLHLK